MLRELSNLVATLFELQFLRLRTPFFVWIVPAAYQLFEQMVHLDLHSAGRDIVQPLASVSYDVPFPQPTELLS